MQEIKAKKNHWFRATEKMLYTYRSFAIRIRSLTQRIEVIRQEMEPAIIGNYDLNEGKSYSVSSPVETAVINRIDGDIIRKLELKISNLVALQDIVECSINTMLTAEEKEMVNMIYFRQLPWQQVCMELHCDKNSYYAKKSDIIKILAWCFGYMPDDVAEEVWGLFADQALMQRHMVG